MIFNYKALDQAGAERGGVIEAININVAIDSLQRRGLVISSIKPVEDSRMSRLKNITFFDRVSNGRLSFFPVKWPFFLMLKFQLCASSGFWVERRKIHFFESL